MLLYDVVVILKMWIQGGHQNHRQLNKIPMCTHQKLTVHRMQLYSDTFKPQGP